MILLERGTALSSCTDDSQIIAKTKPMTADDINDQQEV